MAPRTPKARTHLFISARLGCLLRWISKGDVTAMLVYVPTKTGERLARPLESDLHLSPWAD
jgi:hypothetical protein